MFVLSAALAMTVIGLWLALLTSPANPQSRGDTVTGVVVVTVMAVIGLVIYWLAYMGHQRTAEVRDGRRWIRSWLRAGPLGTDRSISLAEVKNALLLRPHHVELSIPGASTRVGTLYGIARDVDRFGTFWWYEDDYHALESALRSEGVDVEYRHVPGLGTLLSAR
jgi:hypothetical protein